MAANFFENQEHARRMTSRLVLLYALAVLGIVGATTLLVHVLFVSSDSGDPWAASSTSGLYVFTAFATLAVIGGGMLLRLSQMSQGGSKVAELLGGVLVDPSTSDPLERRLINVVEEMAIASSIPVPDLYILRNETSINAFAAGLTPTSAVIGVTRGALEKLSRDELQGVIAHEFSHIFNGDMKLNIRLIGVLGGIMALSTLGHVLLRSMGRSRGGRGRGGGAVALIGLLGLGLFAIGFIGVFFARLIKAAVSRQREFLADASAVQYTRNPLGIGGALLRISRDQDHALIKSSYADEASHLFFGSALRFSQIFATHPAVEDRVKRIDPQLLLRGPAKSEGHAAGVSADSMGSVAGFSPMAAAADRGHQVVSKVGEIHAEDVDAARSFLSALPEIAREAAKTGEGSKSLVVGLLLSDDEEVRSAQRQLIRSAFGAQAVDYAETIKKQIGPAIPGLRLPLLETSLPALRRLPSSEKSTLLVLLRELVWADRHYHMFEYVILTLVRNQLLRSAARVRGVTSLAGAKSELSVLMSAVAHIGANDEAQAQRALLAAVSHFSGLEVQPEFLTAEQCGALQLETALNRLSSLHPMEKQKLIEACTKVILDDRMVRPEEIEALQAICTVLDVPVPAKSALSS
jgi:Zn-dependent protease with chaperone function